MVAVIRTVQINEAPGFFPVPENLEPAAQAHLLSFYKSRYLKGALQLSCELLPDSEGERLEAETRAEVARLEKAAQVQADIDANCREDVTDLPLTTERTSIPCPPPATTSNQPQKRGVEGVKE